MLGMPPLGMLKGVLALYVVVHFAHHLSTGILVPLLPLLRKDFVLDYFEVGVLVSAFSVAYGVAQLPGGWLSDRLGRRLLLGLGLVVVGIWTFSIGLSQSYYQVALFLALMGLSGGSYHPAAPPLVAESIPSERRGGALGIHQVGGSSGFFVAPLLAGLIAAALGWRGAFVILALPAVVTGLLFLRLVREKKAVAVEAVSTQERRGSMMGEVVRLIGAVVIVSIVAQAITVAINSFIPLYLVDKHSVKPEYAGMLLSFIYFSGFIAAPLAGALSDRVGRRPLILLSVVATGPLVYLLTIVPFGAGLMALFVLLGVTMYMRMPVIETLIVDVVPPRRRSSVLGMFYFTSMETSSVLTPGVGYLIDRLGLDQTFTILALVVAVSALGMLFTLRYSRQTSQGPST